MILEKLSIPVLDMYMNVQREEACPYTYIHVHIGNGYVLFFHLFGESCPILMFEYVPDMNSDMSFTSMSVHLFYVHSV